MTKRLVICAVALLLVAGISLAADKNAKEGSWTGWVTDTRCGAKGDNPKHADCARKCVEMQGAKFALYTPNDKKVYVLDPQDEAADHAGQLVKVTGTVEGDTITAKSIEPAGEQKGQTKK